ARAGPADGDRKVARIGETRHPHAAIRSGGDAVDLVDAAAADAVPRHGARTRDVTVRSGRHDDNQSIGTAASAPTDIGVADDDDRSIGQAADGSEMNSAKSRADDTAACDDERSMREGPHSLSARTYQRLFVAAPTNRGQGALKAR